MPNANVAHCLVALLWSETDDTGTPLDTIDAVPSPELVTRVAADWERFRDAAEALGFDAEEHLAQALHPDCDGDAWNAAAHDFILTRNGHGTGFWDSGRWTTEDNWNRRMAALAESFGEFHCYVGDDGAIYGD